MAERRAFWSVLAVTAELLSATPGQAARPRCEHVTEATNGRFVILGSEVYDIKTNLTWERCSVGQSWNGRTGCIGAVKQFPWDEAMSQAKGAWRVPTADELTTLVSVNCARPWINEEAFPDMDFSKLWYWTGTEKGAFGAMSVHFGGHGTEFNYREGKFAVRLVRSGH